MSQIGRIKTLAKGKLDNIITDLELKDPTAVESAKELHKKGEIAKLKSELLTLTVQLKTQQKTISNIEDKESNLTEAVKIAKNKGEVELAKEGAIKLIGYRDEKDSVKKSCSQISVEIEILEKDIEKLLHCEELLPCSLKDLQTLKTEVEAENLLNSL